MSRYLNEVGLSHLKIRGNSVQGREKSKYKDPEKETSWAQSGSLRRPVQMKHSNQRVNQQERSLGRGEARACRTCGPWSGT